jgi:hypothetical protein
MATEGLSAFTPTDASDSGWRPRGSSALRPPPSPPAWPGLSPDRTGADADRHRADPGDDRADGDDTDSSGAPGEAGRRPRRRWRLVAIYVVVGALLVAAVVVGIQANRQLGRTDDSLNAIRGQLRQTTAQVAVARSKLAVVTGESAAAERTLETETTQLAADQSQLAQAQAGVHAKGVSISELDTCLSGVEQALNQIAVGDQGGAAATLNRVSAHCQSAEPSG